MTRGNRYIQAVRSITFGCILAANIFIFLPLTLYTGNVDEFTVSFFSILEVFLLPTIYFVAFIAFTGFLVKKERFPGYLAVLAAISILLWFQGNLLPWEYGLLDGREIDWSQGAWRGWVDLGVWAGFLLFVLFSDNRTVKPVLKTAVVIFALQAGLVMLLLFENAQAYSERLDPVTHLDDVDNIYRFSSASNVLHILADGFQSDIFEEILEEDGGEVFSGALDGFVFFPENLGIFQYTHMTIPAILGGKVYTNHKPVHEFLDEVIGGATFLNEAFRSGYEVDLAVPASLRRIYTKSRYTNAYLVPVNRHVTSSDYGILDAARLFDLALFRAVPHFLKKYVYNDQLWFSQAMISGNKYMGLRFFSHTAFLREIREKMSADRDVPVYKFLHLMLSHNPMVATRDCEYAGMVLPSLRENVKNQARCGLVEVARLFERMKELGIYDDATIVLMADHGTWITPLGLKRETGAAVVRGPHVGEALPLMVIKLPGATGPVKKSRVFSSIVDTPATIASIIGLDASLFDGKSVFDLSPGEPRERKHYMYEYTRTDWESDYLAPIQEYLVNGSAYSGAAWRKGAVFPPGTGIDISRQ